MKLYLASGFFSEDQKAQLSTMEDAAERAGVSVFSPRKANLWKPGDGGDGGAAVVARNIAEIKACDAVLASTVGKDMGTLWECGFANCAKVPVIYYYPEGDTFNLMLVFTAHAVLTSETELAAWLEEVAADRLLANTYIGEKQ